MRILQSKKTFQANGSRPSNTMGKTPRIFQGTATCPLAPDPTNLVGHWFNPCKGTFSTITGEVESTIGDRSGEAFPSRGYKGNGVGYIDLSAISGNITVKACYVKDDLGQIHADSFTFSDYKNGVAPAIPVTVDAAKNLVLINNYIYHGLAIYQNGILYDFLNCEEGNHLVARGSILSYVYEIKDITTSIHITDKDIPYSFLNEIGYSVYKPKPTLFQSYWSELDGVFTYDGTKNSPYYGVVWAQGLFKNGNSYTIEIEVVNYQNIDPVKNWLDIELWNSGQGGQVGVFYDKNAIPVINDKKTITFTYQGGSVGVYARSVYVREIIMLKISMSDIHYIPVLTNNQTDNLLNPIQNKGRVKLKAQLVEAPCFESDGIAQIDFDQAVTKIEVNGIDITNEVSFTGNIGTVNTGVQLFDMVINDVHHYPVNDFDNLTVPSSNGGPLITISNALYGDVLSTQDVYHYHAVGEFKSRTIKETSQSKIKFPECPRIRTSGIDPEVSYFIHDFQNWGVPYTYWDNSNYLKTKNLLVYNIPPTNDIHTKALKFTNS